MSVEFTSILVVDDEPLVLNYISSIFRRMGCAHVLEAENAEAGTAHIVSGEIDLLVCDITLPDGDGRRVASTLLEKNPSAVVVLITGFRAQDIHLSPELRSKALLLEKPFTPDDMSELLGRHFEESRMVHAGAYASAASIRPARAEV
jgi:DNA-binding NtrC family response regulator